MPSSPLPKDARRFLFVCTGNSCRSVMAEGLFKKMVQEKGWPFEVQSCGISAFAGSGASLETIKVMKEKAGIDVSGHLGQRISSDLLKAVDVIFVMQRIHKDYIRDFFPDDAEKVYLLTDYYTREGQRLLEYGIPDPIGMTGEFYQNVLEIIRKSLEGLIRVMDETRSSS